MGAIWGVVTFDGKVNNGFELMQPVYENKCRLDSIDTKEFGDAKMGNGKLFVRPEDEGTVLPNIDEEKQILLATDCLIDNGLDVFKSYIEYGTDCFSKLRGLFSIAVWHEKEKKLILAADQTSSRCLYYYRKNGCFYFSTLIESIIKAVGEIEKNTQYLEDFLMAPGMMPNLFSDDTPYLGVKKCNPGEWLEITADGITVHKYYDLSENSTSCGSNADEVGKNFRKLYEECVADAVNTNAGVAICLSSGLDSASIGALAAKKLKEQGKMLQAFTYVPAEEGAKKSQKNFVIDETQDVLDICKPFENIENHFVNNKGKNCIGEIEKCLDIMEIPVKAFVNFPNLFEIFEEAEKRGCKVVLTGQNGNATVSNGYIDDVLFDLWEKKQYLTYVRYLNSYCKNVKESRKSAFESCNGYFKHSKECLERGLGDYPGVNPFLNKEMVDSYPVKERFAEAGMKTFEKVPSNEEMHREFLTKKALYTYLGEYETKLGLRYGVVVRDATKDLRMLEFCYRIPYKYYAYNGIPRWLIRGNMKDLLPEKLLNQWMRYGVQNVDWIKRVKRDWDKESVKSFIEKYVNSAEMKKYVDEERVESILSQAMEMDEIFLDWQLTQICFLQIVGLFFNR